MGGVGGEPGVGGAGDESRVLEEHGAGGVVEVCRRIPRLRDRRTSYAKRGTRCNNCRRSYNVHLFFNLQMWWCFQHFLETI